MEKLNLLHSGTDILSFKVCREFNKTKRTESLNNLIKRQEKAKITTLEPNKTEAKNPSSYISPCITYDHIKVDDGIFLTEGDA